MPRVDLAASEAEIVRSPIQLFNGRDLTGFVTWLVDTRALDPRGVFSVTNGSIRISGAGLGYLETGRRFKDYHLRLEYRWGDRNHAWGDRIGKARDSGLFLHSQGPPGNSEDGGGAYKAAVECNLFEGATGDFLLIRGRDEKGMLIAPRLTAETAPQLDADGWPFWQPDGQRRTLDRWGRLNWLKKDRSWRDQFGFRGTHDLEKPTGQWNSLECICDGSKITVRLNGTTVNEAFDVYPDSGSILLQCEGSEIFFRRFELTPLPRNNAIAKPPAEN